MTGVEPQHLFMDGLPTEFSGFPYVTVLTTDSEAQRQLGEIHLPSLPSVTIWQTYYTMTTRSSPARQEVPTSSTPLLGECALFDDDAIWDGANRGGGSPNIPENLIYDFLV